MHKIFSPYLFVGTIALFVVLMPHNLFAAELIFKIIPNTIVGDNSKIVQVRIDPQSKNLNVVEGTIGFQGPAVDKLSVDVDINESVLKMWPTSPLYVPSEKVVQFTGGVPNGFSSEGLLFTMRVSSVSPGDIKISWMKDAVYLNDGKGTKESVTNKPINLNLEQQKSTELGKKNTTTIDNTTNNQTAKYSPMLASFKYVGIILLGIVLSVLYYAYKKIIKK